jgi:hypothetical protein
MVGWAAGAFNTADVAEIFSPFQVVFGGEQGGSFYFRSGK